jgi:hypothetical protein
LTLQDAEDQQNLPRNASPTTLTTEEEKEEVENENDDNDQSEGYPNKKTKGCFFCGWYPPCCLVGPVLGKIVIWRRKLFCYQWIIYSRNFSPPATTWFANTSTRVFLPCIIGNPQIPIPHCVLKKVGFYFPDSSHMCMGFKADFLQRESDI